MINREGACLAVKDAKYALSLTHAGLAWIIGTFREMGASISALRAIILERNHSGTTSANTAPRIAFNAI